MHLLVFLDQPHELLRGVADLLGRRAEVEQTRAGPTDRRSRPRPAAPTARVARASRRAGPRAGSPARPARCRGAGARSTRGRRRPPRGSSCRRRMSTARSRSVMAGSSSTAAVRHSGAPASSRTSAMPSRAPRRITHVVGEHHVFAVGIEQPLASAPKRDHAHADLHRQLDVGELAAGERRAGADAHAVRHLFGGGQVGNERGRNAETVRDDARRRRPRRCPCARSPTRRAARSTSARRRASTAPRARTPRASRG